MAHSKTIGGSTAHRTLNCPAWIPLREHVPAEIGSSSYAAEGTMLHAICEKVFSSLPTEHGIEVGSIVEGITVTLDHMDLAGNAMIQMGKALNYLGITDDDDVVAEPVVAFKQGVLAEIEAFGSVDMLALSPDEKTLFIGDYKFGAGIEVEAEDNSQLLFYAAAAIEEFELQDTVEQVTLCIVQPRLANNPKMHTVPVQRVYDFVNSLEIAWSARYTASPNEGSWCKFCPVESVCPAKTGLMLSTVKWMEENPNWREHVDKISDVLKAAETLEPMFKAAKAEANKLLEGGVPVEGYKLVNKQARRVWADEEAVLGKVRRAKKIKLDEATDTKLKSPAQLEKLFSEKGIDFSKISEYISRVSSGTTMVKSSDKRQDIRASKQLPENLKTLITENKA